MKVISLKLQKLLLLLPAAEEKLNKIFVRNKKASVITCLFLLSALFSAPAQDCAFPVDTETHRRILNLQFEIATQVVPAPKSVADHYLLSLAESLELIVSENPMHFSEYEDNFQDRLDLNLTANQRDLDFLRAEAKLQWAFVYLKFGHEFDAALNLRDAYQIARDLKRKAPDYLPIRKTTGLLNVIVGSVPEKYNWILSLLGMEGSISEGIKDLNKVRTSTCFLKNESDLLYALVQGYILQKPDSGLVAINHALTKNPADQLTLFLTAALLIKNSQSEEALKFLKKFKEQQTGIEISYADYLMGEVFLHTGDYEKAITAYVGFIEKYKGQNYIKDAHFKIGLCFWLNGIRGKAMEYFTLARSAGRAESEADKAADRSLKETDYPHVMLSKARYFTDGGLYEKAEGILDSIPKSGLPNQHDQTEYYYRRARLAHKSGRIDAAKLFYRQTIDLAGRAHWYFAPNACLQMGYILLDEQKKSEAKKYFQQALEYKNHEYKNSIDAKAKSALAQLRKK
jgi:tetratricopeptide (TPR) repeat protein